MLGILNMREDSMQKKSKDPSRLQKTGKNKCKSMKVNKRRNKEKVYLQRTRFRNLDSSKAIYTR